MWMHPIPRHVFHLSRAAAHQGRWTVKWSLSCGFPTRGQWRSTYGPSVLPTESLFTSHHVLFNFLGLWWPAVLWWMLILHSNLSNWAIFPVCYRLVLYFTYVTIHKPFHRSRYCKDIIILFPISFLSQMGNNKLVPYETPLIFISQALLTIFDLG